MADTRAVSRNDPCPCGSGLRYKDCHGRIAAPGAVAASATPRAPQPLGAPNAATGPARVVAPIVDFIVAGTQKGGTTALFSYLKEHPQLRVPRGLKELHYFDRDEYFTGTPDARQYHMNFGAAAPDVRVTGEATPFYMYWKPVPARVHAYNPAMKWIVLLRDPAARAHSHWNWESSRGRESLAFEDALAAEPSRLAAEPNGQHRRHSYVDRGRYGAQLDRIEAQFPREQLLVLKSELLQREPAVALDAVARFLGIDGFAAAQPRSVNAQDYRESVSPRARTFLAEAFASEIDALEARLGWDLVDWRH